MKIIICGIGGQGVIKLSDIIAHGFFLSGIDVKKSDILGMSQRGGSVLSHVRPGPSPMNLPGDVDCMIALEEIEAFNNLYWKPKVLLMNRFIYEANVNPLPKKLKFPTHTVRIDATKKAIEHGNIHYTNILMLKNFIEFSKLDKKPFIAAIKKFLPKHVDKNISLLT
ncbi:2-oxoacid:acceptor oxidoreductase family protein [Candidatus Woesearchaeota archaeon]|nr:2-oxoacid:acceptor oxidoreductase family protein [Candidatus Woesearchaeota archaeon]